MAREFLRGPYSGLSFARYASTQYPESGNPRALKGFVLPPVIVMILGAYGLFSATFLISIWIFILSLFSMEGAGPVGQLRLALSATICIVPIILGIIGVSR